LIASIHLLAQEPVSRSARPNCDAASAPPAGTANDPVRVNVSVDLVNIAATVRDSSGRYLSGLTQDDFTVLENGPSKSSHSSTTMFKPISVSECLLIRAGACGTNFSRRFRRYEKSLLALRPQDEMFLITFNDDVEVRQKFTKNPDDIVRALRGIRSGGETSVYDAVQAGIQEMKNAKNGKRIFVACL
jgi:Ca-activated chloride channel family protein